MAHNMKFLGEFLLKFGRQTRLSVLLQPIHLRCVSTSKSAKEEESLRSRAPKPALSAYNVYMSQGLKQHQDLAPHMTWREYFKHVSDGWKALDEGQMSKYVKISEESKKNHMEEVKKFQESLTSEEAKQLNKENSDHTRMLRRKRLKEEKKMLGVPKKSKSAYIFFIQDHYVKQPNVSVMDAIRALSQQWRHISDTQKQAYSQAAVKDKERYTQEMKEYENKLVDSDKKHLLRWDTRLKLYGSKESTKVLGRPSVKTTAKTQVKKTDDKTSDKTAKREK